VLLVLLLLLLDDVNGAEEDAAFGVIGNVAGGDGGEDIVEVDEEFIFGGGRAFPRGVGEGRLPGEDD